MVLNAAVGSDATVLSWFWRASIGASVVALLALVVRCKPEAAPRFNEGGAVESLSVIAGTVKDVRGQPLSGIHVTVLRPEDGKPVVTGKSGPTGEFSLKCPAGHYAITTTSPTYSPGYASPASVVQRGRRFVKFTLSKRTGHIIDGRVVAPTGAPWDQSFLLRFTRKSHEQGDVFFVRTDEVGWFRVRLEALRDYWIEVEGPEGFRSLPSAIQRLDRDAEVLVTAFRPKPAPDTAIAWMKDNALPLVATAPDEGTADLQPLVGELGGAKVIGLGESTHGTREFFLLKHRLVRFAVEILGYRAIAFEADVGAAAAIDRYVLGGQGSPIALLEGLRVWPWATEEVVELLIWLRRFNYEREDPVRFYGIDAQWTADSTNELNRYLRRLDPAYAQSVSDRLSGLTSRSFTEVFRSLPPAARRELDQTLAGLSERLDRPLNPRGVSTQGTDYIEARRLLKAVRQAVKLAGGMDHRNVRDESMASNVIELLDQHKGGVVVWAHNGHIARGDYPFKTMGEHLVAKLGSQYFAVGFSFGEGSFQAMEISHGPQGKASYKLKKYSLGRPSGAHFEATVTNLGHPLVFLNLRRARGAARDWLRQPVKIRGIGSTFPGKGKVSSYGVVARRWDAVVYVDRTTRARPIGRWLRMSDIARSTP